MRLRFYSIIFLFLSSVISLSVYADEPRHPDFKVIVTGGLGGLKSGYEHFFDSKLFRLNQKDPNNGLRITNTNHYVYRYGNLYLLVEKELSPSQVSRLSSEKILEGGTDALYMGSTAYAIRISKKSGLPEFIESPVLSRDIGAIKRKIRWERKKVDGIEALALAIEDLAKENISWPSKELGLVRVPGVSGHYLDDHHHVFFARSMASTEQAMDIVTELRGKSKVPVAYMDLGGSIAGDDHVTKESVDKMLALLVAQKPIALTADNAELRASVVKPNLFAKSPYLMAAQPPEGKEILVSRQTVLAGKSVQISELGQISESAEAFLLQGQRALTPSEALAEARADAIKYKPNLVFGLAQSPDAASLGNESPLFDAVFSLVEPNGVLPARDAMSFEKNIQKGLRSVSPLVRVAPTDVTEVSFFLDPNGQVDHMIIDRHPVVDAPSKLAKEEYQPVLPTRSAIYPAGKYWQPNDFDAIFGQILKASAGADVAIFEKTGPKTPIFGKIPRALAHSYLNRPGRAISFILQGSNLKKILKMVSSGDFPHPATVVGATLKGPTVDQRALQDTEPYHLVTTEKVGSLIYEILDRGSLFEENPNGLTYIELALKENKGFSSLNKYKKFTKKPHVVLDDRLETIRKSPAISEIVEAGLKHGLSASEIEKMLAYEGGKVRASIILDVADLDLGMDGNWINARAEELNQISVPDSRMTTNAYLHLLFNSNIYLKFVTDPLDITLQNEIKFYTSGRNEKPTADKFELSLDFRVPIERLSNFPPTKLALSPVAGVSYETKLWPLPGITQSVPDKADEAIEACRGTKGESYWRDCKGWIPRKTNLLRGYLGGVGATVTSDELFRVMGLIQYNFAEKNGFDQAFALGIEAKSKYTWKFGISKLKASGFARFLFPTTKTPDAQRLGIIAGVTGKFEVPLWRFLSVGLTADIYGASTMAKLGDFGISSILGISLSYSQNARWIL